MTIFSRIFGKRIDTPSFRQVEEERPEMPKDLFIEERHPRELESPDYQRKTARQEKSLLASLLDRDYESMGHKDGYRMHDLCRLEEQLEIIAADFRQVIDMALQDIEIQLDKLRMHLTDKMEVEASDLYEKMHTRDDQLVKQKRELMLQKDLAISGQGFVERPFKYYKAGFKRGYDLYIQEELIFKHIKTL